MRRRPDLWRPPAHHPVADRLVMHAEALAAHLEELQERVHLLRDELWALRAELGREVRR